MEMSTVIVKNRDKKVLQSLREDYNIPLDAPCGGQGTCGKCKVRIVEGEVDTPEDAEKAFLSDDELKEGLRLACYITPRSDLHIDVDHHAGPVQILEDHRGFQGELNPLVKKQFLQLNPPSLDDQRDDVLRILEEVGNTQLALSHNLRARIPALCRENEYKITAVYTDEKLLKIEAGDTSAFNYALACDIGTTTVVVYLLDAVKGEIIDTASDLNAQKSFGADVIARIDYTRNTAGGVEKLQEKKLKQIESLGRKLLERNNCDPENLNSVTLAGNTTMLHLLAGVDPQGIATAPFIPAFLDSFSCKASELGDFFADCLFYFLPSISAYVGADIVAGVQATGMYESEELTLLVDLGTNGELILGDKNGFTSCSTAAGPAFEGAHIQCGTGAIEGAVNSVNLHDGKVEYTSIGQNDPVGICGSAIVDLTAQLLDKAIMDETGRLSDEDELEGTPYSAHVKEESFYLTPESDIFFSQKDIREVQLAKAAVAAGIETLLHEAGKSSADVKHLYIAGGFGNYIDKKSAAAIGLIPSALLDRTVSVGNTAGLGAINCALNKDYNEICREIRLKTTYVELSGSAWFQQKYMEEMVFSDGSY